MKTLGYILLTAVCYFGALISIIASAFNAIMAFDLWNKVPQGWSLRPIGWDGLLILNTLCTFLISSVLLFVVVWLPRRIDQHVNANRSGNANAH